MNLERTQCITNNCVYYWKYQLEALKREENEESGDFWKVSSPTLQIIFWWVWSFNIIIRLHSGFLKWDIGSFHGLGRVCHGDKILKVALVCPLKHKHTHTHTPPSKMIVLLCPSFWFLCPPGTSPCRGLAGIPYCLTQSKDRLLKIH